jgi:hypothetical protein
MPYPASTYFSRAHVPTGYGTLCWCCPLLLQGHRVLSKTPSGWGWGSTYGVLSCAQESVHAAGHDLFLEKVLVRTEEAWLACCGCCLAPLGTSCGKQTDSDSQMTVQGDEMTAVMLPA